MSSVVNIEWWDVFTLTSTQAGVGEDNCAYYYHLVTEYTENSSVQTPRTETEAGDECVHGQLRGGQAEEGGRGGDDEGRGLAGRHPLLPRGRGGKVGQGISLFMNM